MESPLVNSIIQTNTVAIFGQILLPPGILHHVAAKKRQCHFDKNIITAVTDSLA